MGIGKMKKEIYCFGKLMKEDKEFRDDMIKTWSISLVSTSIIAFAGYKLGVNSILTKMLKVGEIANETAKSIPCVLTNKKTGEKVVLMFEPGIKTMARISAESMKRIS